MHVSIKKKVLFGKYMPMVTLQMTTTKPLWNPTVSSGVHLPGNVNKWKWNYCDWPVRAYTFPFAFSPHSLINEIRFAALAWRIIIIKLRYNDSLMRDIAKPKSLKWMWENLQRGKTWGTNTVGKGEKRERNTKVQGFYLFLSWLASHIKRWDMTTR